MNEIFSEKSPIWPPAAITPNRRLIRFILHLGERILIHRIREIMNRVGRPRLLARQDFGLDFPKGSGRLYCCGSLFTPFLEFDIVTVQLAQLARSA